jgi:hypothetical protein
VRERAAIGIRSDPSVGGGLPVPDIEVPDSEGEREYCRLSDTPMGAVDGMRWLDVDDDP